jgi:ferritin-like metal-binding protein YciE
MLGTPMTLDNLEKVLLLQMRDLASAEEQLIGALPEMADAAASADLKKTFQTHLAETRQHRSQLNKAFRLLGHQPVAEPCEAMEGLITECREVIDLDGDPDVKDAALIAAAQRIEHYEIAGYGCARTFARHIGRDDVAELLQQSLDEETNADKTLTYIAERINIEAARP